MNILSKNNKKGVENTLESSIARLTKKNDSLIAYNQQLKDEVKDLTNLKTDKTDTIEYVQRIDDLILFDTSDPRARHEVGNILEVIDEGTPTKVKVIDVKDGVDKRGKPIFRTTLKKL